MSETRISELVKRSQRQNDLAATNVSVLEFGSEAAGQASEKGFFANVIRWFIWEEGSTIARWKYEWLEVEYNTARSTLPVVDGRSGSIEDGLWAINILETHNTINDATSPSATWQSSVNVDIGSDDFPDGITVQPIGGGTSGTIGRRVTVWMREARDVDGNLFYWFSMASSVFGPCEAPGA